MGNKEKSRAFRNADRAEEAARSAWATDLAKTMLQYNSHGHKVDSYYYREDPDYTPTAETNLHERIENLLRSTPFGAGQTCNAYYLQGAFAGNVLNINRKALRERLDASTMLYPVKILTKNIGAPIWMNEAGTLQIQSFVAGDSLQKIYDHSRD